jgi:hypothetical protein
MIYYEYILVRTYTRMIYSYDKIERFEHSCLVKLRNLEFVRISRIQSTEQDHFEPKKA